jgi:hypothetical protein
MKLTNNLFNALIGRMFMNTIANNNNTRNRPYLTMKQRYNRTHNKTNAMRRINNRNNNNRKQNVKDVGGYKQVYYNGPIATQTIEMYKTIGVSGDPKTYVFDREGQTLDISALLNDTNEFLELRRRSLQFKVLEIDISFNYNRHPNAGDKFPKMLVTPETDMVIQNSDPKVNKNTMVWDMTTNGNKNYNFRITNRNTEKVNNEWQIAESFWNAICKIHLSDQGNIFLVDMGQISQTWALGEMKISVLVAYTRNDTSEGFNKRNTPTTSQAIQAMKNLMQLPVYKQLLLANEPKSQKDDLEISTITNETIQ